MNLHVFTHQKTLLLIFFMIIFAISFGIDFLMSLRIDFGSIVAVLTATTNFRLGFRHCLFTLMFDGFG